MNLDKKNIKKIRSLMLFAAAVLLAVIYVKDVLAALLWALAIIMPFLIGGVLAFVINIPMRSIERHLFARGKSERMKRFRRPVSLTLALTAIVLALVFVISIVAPQLARTIVDLGNRLPVFAAQCLAWLEKLAKDYPQLEDNLMALGNQAYDWNGIVNSIWNFLKNGAGSMLRSTVGVAGSIISGVANGLIAFVFAIYILAQKEKLADQFKRLFRAYLPPKRNEQTLRICSLLYQNFSRFITGQCLEALILGTMFFVSMSILRFPYALLVGVLIAFTALVPILGAFVGCFVGAFLILMVNPLQALWFVILFLFLQQVEGNLIYPRVVGSSVGLPSIWVLAAVTVGGSIFGIAGMLCFIPLLSTAYALLRDDANARNESIAKKS